MNARAKRRWVQVLFQKKPQSTHGFSVLVHKSPPLTDVIPPVHILRPDLKVKFGPAYKTLAAIVHVDGVRPNHCLPVRRVV
jgi:hypothetical protein